jgi:hypothetical protein
LRLVSGQESALAVAGRLEAAWPGRRNQGAVELHIAERARDGTQGQREIARKLMQRHPLSSPACLAASSKLVHSA